MENSLYCWIFFFEMVYWLLVKNLDLCLSMSGFYKYVFSLIRWNQLTRKVIANGFYKYIKIYCFFLKHFITLLNVPFSFLCCHWQSTVIICSLMPFPENIDLWPWLCMCVCGILGMCICIYLFLAWCLFLSPVLFSVFNLWPEEKQSTQTIKKLFRKGCLKWHRTQGLMSNLSKSGIKATAEMLGTAETLKKAVASDCYPSGISGRCLLETLLTSLIMSAVPCKWGWGQRPSILQWHRGLWKWVLVSACLSLNRNAHLITYSNILLGRNLNMRPHQPRLPLNFHQLCLQRGLGNTQDMGA